jgi:hypothetical protein
LLNLRLKKNINIQVDYLKQLKQKKRLKQKQEKKDQKQIFDNTTKLLNDHQRNLKQKQKDMMMEITLFNKKRAKEKQDKMEEQLRLELERDSQTQQRIKDEKNDFFKYAETCINEWKSGGKNVMPLLLEMKKYKDFMVNEERQS